MLEILSFMLISLEYEFSCVEQWSCTIFFKAKS